MDFTAHENFLPTKYFQTSISNGHFTKRKGLKVGKGLTNDDAVTLHLLSQYERKRLR